MSLQEIETAIAELSPEELRAFFMWFAQFLDTSTSSGDSIQKRKKTPVEPGSVSFEGIEHLAGSIKDGPLDLATNKKHLEGLSESSMR